MKRQEDLCVVIAGGGIKGAGLIGAVQYLFELYPVEKIRAFVGSSVGALTGYLLSLGYNPLEIVHYTIRNEVLQQLSSFSEFADTLFSNNGLISFEPISEFLELMTLAKHGKLFTFQNLYDELGMDFACVTYNYSKLRMEILHRTTTPDLPCITAVQMSCAIPYVFTQCMHNNQIYLDGGLVDNFPIRVALKLNFSNIIGITTTLRRHKVETELSLMMVLTLSIIENTRKTIRKFRKRFEIIDVQMDTNPLDFGADLPAVMELFSTGYRSCKSHFQ